MFEVLDNDSLGVGHSFFQTKLSPNSLKHHERERISSQVLSWSVWLFKVSLVSFRQYSIHNGSSNGFSAAHVPGVNPAFLMTVAECIKI